MTLAWSRTGLGGFEGACEETDVGGVTGYASKFFVTLLLRCDRGGLGGAPATFLGKKSQKFSTVGD